MGSGQILPQRVHQQPKDLLGGQRSTKAIRDIRDLTSALKWVILGVATLEKAMKIPQTLLEAMKQLDGERPACKPVDNTFHNCLHCGNPLEDEQRMFCCADCFKLNRFHKMDKHQHGKVYGKGGRTRNSLKNPKRSCEYCKSEFRPVSHREYLCSPQCKILSDPK